jgi:hypothetical protein
LGSEAKPAATTDKQNAAMRNTVLVFIIISFCEMCEIGPRKLQGILPETAPVGQYPRKGVARSPSTGRPRISPAEPVPSEVEGAAAGGAGLRGAGPGGAGLQALGGAGLQACLTTFSDLSSRASAASSAAADEAARVEGPLLPDEPLGETAAQRRKNVAHGVSRGSRRHFARSPARGGRSDHHQG